MKNNRNGILSIALSICALGAVTAPASAQEFYSVPHYSSWQPGWDQGQYDRHHVLLGVVHRFRPYRLWIQRYDGQVQQIDLRNGTVIRPLDATPHRGDHVAVIGYYSNGTFIARRVVLR